MPAIELEGLDAPLRRAGGARRRHGRRSPPARRSSCSGPTAPGKTTLLRILATLLRPHAGAARVLGRELPREAWRVRGRIGFLGHEPLLYRDLSARENLAFHARLHGLRRPPSGSRSCSRRSAWTRRGDDRVRTLSRGMVAAPRRLPRRAARARAAAARRAARQPRPRGADAGRAADRPRRAAARACVTSHDPAGGLAEARPRARAARRARRAARARRRRHRRRDRSAVPVSAPTPPGRSPPRRLLAQGPARSSCARRSRCRRWRCSRVTTFVIFRFGLDRDTLDGDLAAGVLWVTLLFAAMLGINRLFVAERERGRLRRLPAGAGRPHRRCSLAKAAALLVYLVVLELVAVPALRAPLLGPTPARRWPRLVARPRCSPTSASRSSARSSPRSRSRPAPATCSRR